ncbi:hypothetical protein V6N13_032467 [Hibiscus sabdariffa]|uniref:Uncharacterized protein n=1 Tax=Hibiscus sabdariffa TaxID=183260 RepID=A0ABR2C250_9ROSI
MPRELASAFMTETDQDTTLPSLNLADYNEISSRKANTELMNWRKKARGESNKFELLNNGYGGREMGTCKSEMKISKAWRDPMVFNLDHTIPPEQYYHGKG